MLFLGLPKPRDTKSRIFRKGKYYPIVLARGHMGDSVEVL
jgi:hypothetical protein